MREETFEIVVMHKHDWRSAFKPCKGLRHSQALTLCLAYEREYPGWRVWVQTDDGTHIANMRARLGLNP